MILDIGLYQVVRCSCWSDSAGFIYIYMHLFANMFSITTLYGNNVSIVFTACFSAYNS